MLFIERSKVLFYKTRHRLSRAGRASSSDTLEHLRAMARKAAYVAPNQVLELPAGRIARRTRFFSIQHDFPLTYGIGRAGLPTYADEARIAKARQFKGYLTFFDQVLADYLGQLAAVRKLFSLDKTRQPDLLPALRDDIAGVARGVRRRVLHRHGMVALQDEVTRTRLTEDEELFLDRRNRLLDHLLARFAERFTDYVLMQFSLEGDQLTHRQGADRGQDRLPARIPDGEPRARQGVQLPAGGPGRGLGQRQRLRPGKAGHAASPASRATCGATLAAASCSISCSARARCRDSSGWRSRPPTIRCCSSRRRRSSTAMRRWHRRRLIYPFIRHQASYVIDSSGGSGQVFYRIEGGGTSLRHDASFDERPDAAREIRALIERYDDLLESDAACDEEGFHLIEHILLRPMSAQDPLLSVCLDPTCEFCGEEDPYSFRITVVLPYWPRRFRNLDFRRFFERMMREETPAHIHARICWIGNAQMAELDAAYHAWLTQKAAPEIDPAALRAALAELIAVLQRLKTVYPAATLHDCIEGGEDGTPVRLGSTNLGIF